MTANSTIVGGVYARLPDAHKAVRELRAAGFEDAHIGLISRRPDGSLDRDREGAAAMWEEGTGIGAAVGATAGTGLGLAIIAGLLTPIGPVIAGGALVGLLASLGVGATVGSATVGSATVGSATVGSAIGGLVGLGISQDDAIYFEHELKAGNTLVTVNAREDLDEAIDVLQRSGGKLRL